jgi:hypothetical protein
VCQVGHLPELYEDAGSEKYKTNNVCGQSFDISFGLPVTYPTVRHLVIEQNTQQQNFDKYKLNNEVPHQSRKPLCVLSHKP